MSAILERFLETKHSLNTRTAYRTDIKGFFQQLSPRPPTDKGPGSSIDSTNPQKKRSELTYQDFFQIPPSTMSEHIAAYLDSVQKIDTHRGYTLNPRTINRKLSALSSFFSYLVRWHEFPSNPIKFFEAFPVHQKSTTPTLNESEMAHILQFMEKQHERSPTITTFRDSLIVRFLFRYALRRSELVSLKWDDFKVESGYFEVIQKGNDPMVKPIIPEDWNLLCQFRSKQNQEGSPYVFHAIRPSSKTGQFEPLSVGYVYKMVRAVGKKLFPEKNITPHSFRGTFVGCALNQKIEAGEIANATGHKDVKMVYYYDRRNPITHNAIVKLTFPLT